MYWSQYCIRLQKKWKLTNLITLASKTGSSKKPSGKAVEFSSSVFSTFFDESCVSPLTDVLGPFESTDWLEDVTGKGRLSVAGIVGLATEVGVTPVTMVMLEGRMIGGPINEEFKEPIIVNANNLRLLI